MSDPRKASQLARRPGLKSYNHAEPNSTQMSLEASDFPGLQGKHPTWPTPSFQPCETLSGEPHSAYLDP